MFSETEPSSKRHISTAMVSAQEFAQAYTDKFRTTVAFLQSRGVFGDEAVEYAQSAWVRAWEHRAQFRQSCALHVWVNTIAYNLRRTSLRHPQNPFVSTPDNLSVIDTTAERMVLARELLSRCSRKDRQFVHELCYLGLSAAELAARHQSTEQAIRLRWWRTKGQIRARI